MTGETIYVPILTLENTNPYILVVTDGTVTFENISKLYSRV